MAAQQRAAACDQERAARTFQRQQQAAESQARAQQAQADSAARQQEYDRQQASIRQAAAIKAKRDAESRDIARKAAEQDQLAAELSSDNHCAEKEFARVIIDEFNGLGNFKARNIKVVDIAHLTTRRFEVEKSEMECHGEFLMNTGMHLKGTFTMRKNIAGDPIIQWVPDR